MALKPPEFYAQMVMTEIGVPPGVSAVKGYNAYFKAIAQMFQDADVSVSVTAGQVPVAGLHVVVPPGVPSPVLGVGVGTGKLT